METSMFINSLQIMGYDLRLNDRGKTFPICSLRVVNNSLAYLAAHIVYEHNDAERSSHGSMLAKLCVPLKQRRPLPTFTLETANEASPNLNYSDPPTVGQMPASLSFMAPTADGSDDQFGQPFEGSDVQHFDPQDQGISMNANSFMCVAESSDLWQLHLQIASMGQALAGRPRKVLQTF